MTLRAQKDTINHIREERTATAELIEQSLLEPETSNLEQLNSSDRMEAIKMRLKRMTAETEANYWEDLDLTEEIPRWIDHFKSNWRQIWPSLYTKIMQRLVPHKA